MKYSERLGLLLTLAKLSKEALVELIPRISSALTTISALRLSQRSLGDQRVDFKDPLQELGEALEKYLSMTKRSFPEQIELPADKPVEGNEPLMEDLFGKFKQYNELIEKLEIDLGSRRVIVSFPKRSSGFWTTAQFFLFAQVFRQINISWAITSLWFKGLWFKVLPEEYKAHHFDIRNQMIEEGKADHVIKFKLFCHGFIAVVWTPFICMLQKLIPPLRISN